MRDKLKELKTERERLMGEVHRHNTLIAACEAFMGAPASNGHKKKTAAPVTKNGKRRGRPPGSTNRPKVVAPVMETPANEGI